MEGKKCKYRICDGSGFIKNKHGCDSWPCDCIRQLTPDLITKHPEEAYKTIESLKAEVDKLRETLKPFANIVEKNRNESCMVIATQSSCHPSFNAIKILINAADTYKAKKAVEG